MTVPTWVLFDLNGSLLDPRPVGNALPGPHGEAIVVETLRDAVAQSMVDTLSGEYRPFVDYLRNALQRQLLLHDIDGGPDLSHSVTAAMTTMPPYDDSACALAVLHQAGVGVGVLTNSAQSRAREALARAGLHDQVQVVISAESVRAYKPATILYREAAARLAVSSADIVLVSAHWWDLAGAKRAGLRTAWVARADTLMPETPAPDYQGSTLAAVAAAITASDHDVGRRHRCSNYTIDRTVS
jgi:2-haloacid dehalogenase